MRYRHQPDWSSHPARLVGVCMGVTLACVGLVFGRADVALLGVPLVLGYLWTKPAEKVSVRIGDNADEVLIEGDGCTVRMRLTCDGHREAQVLLGPGASSMPVGLHCVRTGPQPPLRVDWDAHGDFLSWFTPASVCLSGLRVVLPQPVALGPVPESRRLRGLTGPSTSTRAGYGFELRDVHLMRPSDSWRRIDWRVTARQPTDTLWVRGTYATGEAVAVLVMDSRDEVGPDLMTWGGSVPLRVDEPTSLDLARHAAASIARRLIESGDRVGLADLATSRRLLTPATGRRHLNRLIYALALSAPIGSPRIRVRPPQVPADAIVYLFSTLLDDESLRLVHTLKSSGHDVLVIDTLPEVRPPAAENMELAWRITSAERRARIRQLNDDHVPVISWAGNSREQASGRLAAIRRAQSRTRGHMAVPLPHGTASQPDTTGAAGLPHNAGQTERTTAATAAERGPR